MNGGAGLEEPMNGAANQIYGGEQAEWQRDGEREATPVDGGAWWGSR